MLLWLALRIFHLSMGCRKLTVWCCRIFFPSSFDLTSPQTLPTVVTIHGGGFCIGTARDDDEWNRAFADSQNMLVISLPYTKAPRMPYPYPLHDLEALYLAVMGDESLPISRGHKSSGNVNGHGKGRVALMGFDAGGNLALALSQLPRVRHHATPPTAAVSISGYLDLERPAAKKLLNRPFKPSLPAPNNTTSDVVAATHEAYAWSYVPYGADLQDPLLSPAFAKWEDEGISSGGGLVSSAAGSLKSGLPTHVCLVGAELDVLAHESWRMACRLVRDGGVDRGDGRYGRWRVPDPDSEDALQRVCGAPEAGGAKTAGRQGDGEQLEMSDLGPAVPIAEREDGLSAEKRFGFEARWEATDVEEAGSVKWILVPDVMHGFDRAPWRAGGGGPEVVQEAETKTRAYVDDVGRWLLGTVWAS